MDVAEAIRTAVPIARLKSRADARCDDGSLVEASELAKGMGYSVLIRDPGGATRPATEQEITSAGFDYQGQTKVREGSTLVSAGWIRWR